jgi:hypothetical protein
MYRKLFAVAVLAFATLAAVATPKAAFAIEYICSCSVCTAHPGYGCHDTKHLSPPFDMVSCSSYLSQYCN